MSLHWRRYVDPLGARGLVETYWDEVQKTVSGSFHWDPKPSLAEGGFEIVAAMLAEPLRRAFHEHLDEHGCADPKRGGRGFTYCEEAMRLWDLLPAGDRILIA